MNELKLLLKEILEELRDIKVILSDPIEIEQEITIEE